MLNRPRVADLHSEIILPSGRGSLNIMPQLSHGRPPIPRRGHLSWRYGSVRVLDVADISTIKENDPAGNPVVGISCWILIL